MKRLKHGNIRSGSEIIKTFEVSCNTVHTGYGCCQSDDCIRVGDMEGSPSGFPFFMA